jgi:hypothetical protein
VLSFFSTFAELLSLEAAFLTTEILTIEDLITNLASPGAPEPPSFYVNNETFNMNLTTLTGNTAIDPN